MIEDVNLLSRLLAVGGEIGTIPNRWQARRSPRCACVQEGSKATGMRGHPPGQAAMDQAHAHIGAHVQQDAMRALLA
ncbi:hypothetical protein [Pseudooceanicola sp.]|uniref:hypothetical protein n=1 Tax=Pseudooceanicola sp. TaxID=1914328 RepID=UPI0026354578|nr:hypothetical protein [Pseudooceanicola sp.]MDF1855058.1 hypothetical protein [Pseudooceanicola sp.]